MRQILKIADTWKGNTRFSLVSRRISSFLKLAIEIIGESIDPAQTYARDSF